MAGQIVESGGQALTIGAIADGSMIIRSGTALVGMPKDRFFAYITDAYSIAAVNTWYDLPWNVAAVHKTGFTHSEGGANPERITFSNAGRYLISYQFLMSETAAAHYVGRIYKNGTTEVVTSFANGSRRYNGFVRRITIADFSASDYVTLQVGSQTASKIESHDAAGNPDPTTRQCAEITIVRI